MQQDKLTRQVEKGNVISITVALSVVMAVAAGTWQASSINTRLDAQVMAMEKQSDRQARAMEAQSGQISALRDTIYDMNSRLVRIETQMKQFRDESKR